MVYDTTIYYHSIYINVLTSIHTVIDDTIDPTFDSATRLQPIKYGVISALKRRSLQLIRLIKNTHYLAYSIRGNTFKYTLCERRIACDWVCMFFFIFFYRFQNMKEKNMCVCFCLVFHLIDCYFHSESALHFHDIGLTNKKGNINKEFDNFFLKLFVCHLSSSGTSRY
jgi:hypothetical protein